MRTRSRVRRLLSALRPQVDVGVTWWFWSAGFGIGWNHGLAIQVALGPLHVELWW